MTSPLREAPEALLQALDDAIVGQRTSVLLASDDGQALDTCGRALLRRLRQRDGLDTSVLYDMDRQLLVERFNRLLESMSIDEARRAERGAVRAQVWLLQIQAAEGIAQAQLLIRLAQEFPGAGVTLVLLAPDAVGRALAAHPAAYAQHQGRPGHPLGFAPELYSELMALDGDAGVRRLLARYPAAAVEVDDPGVLREADIGVGLPARRLSVLSAEGDRQR